MNENFKIELKSSFGSCDSAIFKKMVSKGDVTATSIKEMINEVVKITGYASCHITTKSKDFDMNYFATDKGIISTGSQIFLDSVEDYIGDTDTFKIVSIRTNNGTTYKVTPILVNEETGEIA